MKKLLIIDYLKSGRSLDDLRKDHGVKSFIQNGKINFNYDQIESIPSDPLSQQCRGLILRESTLIPVAVPMFRFFNIEQSSINPEIDYKCAAFEEKCDGTLIICYFDSELNKWLCGTRGRPEADVPIDRETITFASLVDFTLRKLTGDSDITLDSFMKSRQVKNPDITHKTFCFELCSPLNKIVCEYNDFTLTLLSVRDLISLEEEDTSSYVSLFEVIKPVKTYKFSDISDLIEFVRTVNPKEHEGIVIKDSKFNRIKVKSPAFVACSHMRDSLSSSMRNCMEVILLEKDDDIVGMVPTFISDRISKLKYAFISLMKIVQEDYNGIKHIDNMKDFAFKAQTLMWPAALFALKRNKAPDLLTFVKGGHVKGNDPTIKIPDSSLDSLVSLCEKIDPSIKELI